MKLSRRAWLALVAACAAGAPLAGGAAEDRLLVLTSLPALYSVSAALAAGTRIDVRNVPEGGRPLAAHASFFDRPPAAVQTLLAQADAVVTMTKLWSGDPLYRAARAANIRVVDIDATKPWSSTLEGVSVALTPTDDAPWSDAPPRAEREPAIHFWLSPSNGALMADIVARDFMALAPEDRDRVAENLASYRRELLELKREYELALTEVADPTVYALAAEPVYLTTDLGVNVDGWFLKQDIAWTPEDAEAFARHLREREIPVVIHKWEPAEPIRAAIERGGARLVVIDLGETGIVEDGRLAVDGYQRLLRKNLDALLAAFREQDRG